jgi:hypothetical protein
MPDNTLLINVLILVSRLSAAPGTVPLCVVARMYNLRLCRSRTGTCVVTLQQAPVCVGMWAVVTCKCDYLPTDSSSLTAEGISVGRSVGQSVWQSVSQSVSRPVNLSFVLSVCRAVGRSVGQLICMSVGRSVSLSVHQPIFRSVSQSVNLSAS